MEIQIGIMSSTHVDRQGDRMAKSALESMVNQIKTKYIPVDVDHQGTYIGVILAAKIRPFTDGEFAVLGIMGIFEDETERQRFQYGSSNTVFDEYLKQLDDLGDSPLPVRSKEEIEEEDRLYKSLEDRPIGLSIGFRKASGIDDKNIALKIYSTRDEQRAIVEKVSELYPNLKVEQRINKSDVPQITQFLIDGLQAVIGIISLAIQLSGKEKQEGRKVVIEITQGKKTMKIEVDYKTDIKGIVREFLKQDSLE